MCGHRLVQRRIGSCVCVCVCVVVVVVPSNMWNARASCLCTYLWGHCRFAARVLNGAHPFSLRYTGRSRVSHAPLGLIAQPPTRRYRATDAVANHEFDHHAQHTVTNAQRWIQAKAPAAQQLMSLSSTERKHAQRERDTRVQAAEELTAEHRRKCENLEREEDAAMRRA